MGCSNSKVENDKVSKTVASNNKSAAGGTAANLSTRSTDSDLSHRNSLRLDTSDASVSLKTLTFRHVMGDPVGREFFMKFLKIEVAEENLQFFEGVEELKAVPMPEWVEAALDLVQTYLTPGVETEVNISDAMKTNILKLASSDLVVGREDLSKALERAQKEIMMILAMGAFPRFIKHKLFKDYKKKAREIREKEDEEELRAAERA